ncbi:hypothetical protein [Nocardia sp. XZ_19_231]|uniref:hypothetical protein n=1 Tax=Nocardia sp. XZ_19_231 TaxID=2769252 RepID=UPI00188E7B83|nr:hypothetical protein [Nocardia sp. XZ_19_231]
MDHNAVGAPALPPGYWTGQHRCEVRYFIRNGTFWVTDGVDVEAAGPKEIEVILAEGTTLSDGWIVFPTESDGKTGTRKICGCRDAVLDLDL